MCSRLFWILSLKQKKRGGGEMQCPLGLCQQRLWVSVERLQRPARSPWGWREEVDERDRRWEGPSAAIGEAAAGEKKGRHALKNNRNTGGNGLVGNQPVNKQSWRLETAASPAPAPGQGDRSVNKLAVALTARKLILTPWKLQMTPFYQEQKRYTSQRDLFCHSAFYFALFSWGK